MRHRAFAATAAVLLLSNTAKSQIAAPDHQGDISGVWNHSPPDYMQGYSGWAFHPEPPSMTPWALERYDANRPTFGPRGVPATESNDPVYECYPPGTPRAYFHPFPIEIIQLPGRVVMLYEYHHVVRQIYTDGRDHRADLPPLWVGDSTGHWEDGVLIVETVNFNDSSWIDREGLPHSDELRLIETFELVDENTLRIGFGFEDPIAFTESWEAERFYTRVDWDIEDFACMERNTNVVFDEFERQMLEYEGEPAN